MPETQTARNKILEYKEQKNMTYAQMALIIGCSNVYVQEVLTGKKKGTDLIIKMIQEFGIK